MVGVNLAWDFNPDTSERTSRFAIKLSRIDEGEINIFPFTFSGQTTRFLGGVFGLNLKNVIILSELTKNGGAELCMLTLSSLLRTTKLINNKSIFKNAKMILARG